MGVGLKERYSSFEENDDSARGNLKIVKNLDDK